MTSIFDEPEPPKPKRLPLRDWARLIINPTRILKLLEMERASKKTLVLGDTTIIDGDILTPLLVKGNLTLGPICHTTMHGEWVIEGMLDATGGVEYTGPIMDLRNTATIFDGNRNVSFDPNMMTITMTSPEEEE